MFSTPSRVTRALRSTALVLSALMAGSRVVRARIDPAHEFAGLRLNQWVAAAMVVLSIGFLLIDRGRAGRSAASELPSVEVHP